MNFLSTKTKTIKTYGRKRRERVVSVSSLTIPAFIMVSSSNVERDKPQRKKLKRNASPTTNLYNTGVDNTENSDNELTHRWRLAKNSPARTTNSHESTEMNNQRSNKRNVFDKSPSPIQLKKPKIMTKSKSIRDQETKVFKSIDNSNISNTSNTFNNYATRLTNTFRTELINTSKKILINTLQDELEVLLNSCKQKQIYTFDEYIGVKAIKNVLKLGEATYSEVFTAITSKFTLNRKIKCVFKIIPFGKGNQCKINDIIQEVKMTSQLGSRASLNVPLATSFITLYSVAVCRGKYPESLLKEWDRWNSIYKSENRRPDYFDETQLYIVLVEGNGGIALETAELKNWAQAWSLLSQVGWGLSQAEYHRDLHWGNVTFKSTRLTTFTYDLPSINIKAEVPTFGIRAYIIDFTFSRMERDNEIIHVDILDEDIFKGEGDYQYDIYRMMKEETKGDWKSFKPKTNLFWLHYLADKLLTSKDLPKVKKDHNEYQYYNAILEFKKRALKSGRYNSALEAMKDNFWRL
ncbi:6400_t:CDS:2 [Diversispora eburnea]|uniref:non-specific serine/threonine protein kinase n=1 Tax=Diversispora eburnea TaxID=1213867 RepID=A0A9N9AHM6_9GLOM|nr:6400_t:CDS:2 [Diversispora eburnea]